MVMHGNDRLFDACLRVLTHCAKKKISNLSLRSAVRNGSLSRIVRPLKHQRTLFNGEMQIVNKAKEGGSFEECDGAKPRREKHGGFERYCRTAQKADKASSKE